MQYIRVIRSEGRGLSVDPDVAEAFELYNTIGGKITMTEMMGTEENIINYVFNFNYLFNPIIKILNKFKINKKSLEPMYIKQIDIIKNKGLDWDLYIKFKLIREEISRYQKDMQNEANNR